MIFSVQELQSNDSDIKKFLEKNIDDTCRLHDVNASREGCLNILRRWCIAEVGDSNWLKAKLMMIFDDTAVILDQDNTNCRHDWVSNNSIPLTCCSITK